MKKIITLFITSLVVFSNVNAQAQHDKKVVGYYAGWAMYARDYNVSDILEVADKYTHINYAFFGINWDESTKTASLISVDPHQDYEHSEDLDNTGDSTWELPGYYGDGEEQRGNIGALKILKEKIEANGGSIKLSLSVGGWTLSQPFPLLADSQNGRETFAQSCVDWLTKYDHFDGIDLDWEFPHAGGYDGIEIVNGNTYDKQTHTANDALNFLLLLKEMREKFDQNGLQNKEISVALGNNRQNLSSQFIGEGNKEDYGRTDHIFDYLNFITFFGYDLGGAWENKTCHNAPLYPSNNTEDPLYRDNNGSWSLDGLLDDFTNILGQDHINKIYVGIPFYGRMFGNVSDSQNNSNLPGLFSDAPRNQLPPSCTAGVPAAPPGTWDPKTNVCERTGAIEYVDLIGGEGLTEIRYPHHFLDKNNPDQVTQEAQNNGWVRYWDDTSKVPYLYNNSTNEFISYDDPTSLSLKVDRILSRGFGGIMIWEISQDIRDRNSDTGLVEVVDDSAENLQVDITLNFKDTENNNLENVAVVLKDENDKELLATYSDDKGNVIFTDVDAYNQYSIEFSLKDFSFTIKSAPANFIEFNTNELDSDKFYNIVGKKNNLGIDSHNIQNIILVPNPATDIINIKNSSHINIRTIEVFNLIGKKVFETIDANNINLKTLENGIYFMKIETDSQISTVKKLIKYSN